MQRCKISGSLKYLLKKFKYCEFYIISRELIEKLADLERGIRHMYFVAME